MVTFESDIESELAPLVAKVRRGIISGVKLEIVVTSEEMFILECSGKLKGDGIYPLYLGIRVKVKN